MEKINISVEGGAREQDAGSGRARGMRHLPIAAVLLIATTITLSSAMGGSLAARPPELELLNLQVFAKHSIHAARSDYEGPTAAVGDVALSDIAITAFSKRGSPMPGMAKPDWSCPGRGTGCFSSECTAGPSTFDVSDFPSRAAWTLRASSSSFRKLQTSRSLSPVALAAAMERPGTFRAPS